MSSFADLIASAHPTRTDFESRRWIFVAYDRLTDQTGPMAEQPAAETGIVMVESTGKGHARKYHKKKLVLVIANMRHYALEQAARGVRVLYHFSPLSHGQALVELQRQPHFPALTAMQPAERELRVDLEAACRSGLRLTLVPDTTWLSTTEDFLRVFGPYKPGKKYVMDRFYRDQRQQTGILMRGGKPVGGQFSFDAENRKPYKGEVPVPRPPAFPPDEIAREVMELVAREYPDHFGELDREDPAGFDYPTTQADADRAWKFALTHLLPHFGPFEDAMRDDELHLFHSRTSALINLGRLLPARMIAEVSAAAEAATIPLASAEGFIRQLLGWREFMRHIHQQTDGYRLLPGVARVDNPYAGAAPSALDAHRPLPAVYWGAQSGMHCMDTVVAQVLREGWSHHITRLMVLSNLATLCGFSPRELTDWFWIGYVDAFDWVVESNVLGMATYADGGVTATKPYVSGAAYINRMSNYCGHCRFDPKRATGPGSCPFTALYWTFLERNRGVLGNNFRLQMPYKTLDRKLPGELVKLRARAEQAVTELEAAAYPSYEEAQDSGG